MSELPVPFYKQGRFWIAAGIVGATTALCYLAYISSDQFMQMMEIVVRVYLGGTPQ